MICSDLEGPSLNMGPLSCTYDCTACDLCSDARRTIMAKSVSSSTGSSAQDLQLHGENFVGEVICECFSDTGTCH